MEIIKTSMEFRREVFKQLMKRKHLLTGDQLIRLNRISHMYPQDPPDLCRVNRQSIIKLPERDTHISKTDERIISKTLDG